MPDFAKTAATQPPLQKVPAVADALGGGGILGRTQTLFGGGGVQAVVVPCLEAFDLTTGALTLPGAIRGLPKPASRRALPRPASL
eukprot:CAMPEP_0172767610 /NCGR_PEP_ID=MMETSP1074-20121228/183227_1 /TAXON_ID=2916 /ORGANISM="Ceratium fusus, Strain PA161109" /LENGTH=84 /DNA_ID=CAMNT_0013602885 /DNA_START=513 /DNA_END=765 /DNA_ORIENTATION=-